jgi:hypothetical protein
MSTHFESFGGFSEADDDSMFDYTVTDERYGEADDDSSFDDSAFDDNYDEGHDDDSAEFLLGGLLSKGIGSAIGAINGIKPTIKGMGKLNIPTPFLPGGLTGGLSAASNLFGKLTSPSGKNLNFKLPHNIATKTDIGVLKKAVDANSAAIKVNTAAIKKEAEAIVSLRKDMKSIDVKHIAATKKQNQVMDAINGRVSKLRKELDKTRQDAQMQTMFSLLMPPKLKTVTFDAAPAANTPVNVSASKFEDNNIFLMLALSGGLGGGTGNDSNSWLPLMLLMK